MKLPIGEANIGSYWDIAIGAAGSRVALQADGPMFVVGKVKESHLFCVLMYRN